MTLIFLLILPSLFNKFHPFFFNILLLLYSLILVMKLNYLFNNYWYSYLFYLLMIGGIMILILYMTSISNNEIYMMKFNYFYIKLFFIGMISYYYYHINIVNMTSENLNMWNLLKSINMMELKILFLNLSVSVFMLLYLFIMMIITVMILSKNNVPLRQMNYEKNF
uniref:NADH dehydrogenase subunit 6 n=1 Tax=Dinocampus coccinellae TaxID=144245 RepID=A0A343YVD2_9HYME|nr:NADH dehydrogenase subunit 6 [Dinocampus coccinellae]